MDKHTIFDHIVSTLRQIGSLGKATITTGQDPTIITGYPSALFNLVRFDTPNQALIDKLKNANIPFVCLPSKKLEAEFETFATQQDLIKADFVTASIFDDLKNWQYTPHPTFQIHKVTTADDLAAFDSITSVVFSHPKKLAFNFLKPTIDHPEIHLFLAMVEKQPVGCGMLSLTNNQAGLYWGGVLPNFRKQGIATALVEYRMNYAKQRSHSSIIVQNMTPSLNLYKRLGFKQLDGLPLYMWNTPQPQMDQVSIL